MVVGEGLFLFYGDVYILCGIKDFAALLALNKFDVVLSGDDFDDGMFTGGGHWLGRVEWYGFCPSARCLSTPFSDVFGCKIMVNSW